jgi:hypothetical protein
MAVRFLTAHWTRAVFVCSLFSGLHELCSFSSKIHISCWLQLASAAPFWSANLNLRSPEHTTNKTEHQVVCFTPFWKFTLYSVVYTRGSLKPAQVYNAVEPSSKQSCTLITGFLQNFSVRATSQFVSLCITVCNGHTDQACSYQKLLVTIYSNALIMLKSKTI